MCASTSSAKAGVSEARGTHTEYQLRAPFDKAGKGRASRIDTSFAAKSAFQRRIGSKVPDFFCGPPGPHFREPGPALRVEGA